MNVIWHLAEKEVIDQRGGDVQTTLALVLDTLKLNVRWNVKIFNGVWEGYGFSVMFVYDKGLVFGFVDF